MSVIFIDPPGQLANTSEPIDFTTDRAVTSISVEFNPNIGNGLREAVWDGTDDANAGGDFSFKYRASSVSGSGPYSWHIVPSGRWPAGFRIRVKEVSSVPSVSASWGAVYTLNLTAQPAIPSITPGAFTVDGYTWWCKGSLDAGGSAALVSGQGLQVSRSAIHPWVGSNVGDLPGALYFDFEQINGFNPSAPFAVQFWWWASSNAYPSNVMGCAGIVSAAKSSGAITDDEARSGFFHTAYFQGSYNNTRLVIRNNSQTSYNVIDSATLDSNLRNHRYTLLQTCVGRVVCGYSDVNTSSGAFSALADLSTPRAFAPVPEGGASVRNYGFMQTMINSIGPAFGVQSCTLGGLQILQPKT